MPQVPHPEHDDANLALLRSGLRCEAISLADAPTGAPTGAAGRWRLNTGAVMAQWLYDLDPHHPVYVVLDLDTATTHRKTLAANYMHWGYEIVGRWENISITHDGIDADLTLYIPDDADDDTTRERLASASFVAAMLRRDHPWEVSIETDDGMTIQYERVLAGAPVTVNGITYEADRFDRPLYIARHATIKAAAIVDYGADPYTAQIAARARAQSSTPPIAQETSPMDAKERMAALTARHPAPYHGLIASAIIAGQTDDEISASISAEEAEKKDKEIEALKAQMAEKDQEIEALKAKEHEDEDKDEEEEDPAKVQARAISARASARTVTTAGTDEANGSDDAPKTYIEAQRLICRENPKLRGPAVRSAVFARFPDLRPEFLRK